MRACKSIIPTKNLFIFYHYIERHLTFSKPSTLSSKALEFARGIQHNRSSEPSVLQSGLAQHTKNLEAVQIKHRQDGQVSLSQVSEQTAQIGALSSEARALALVRTYANTWISNSFTVEEVCSRSHRNTRFGPEGWLT